MVRKIRVNISLTPLELAVIDILAAQARQSRSEYLTHRALGVKGRKQVENAEKLEREMEQDASQPRPRMGN